MWKLVKIVPCVRVAFIVLVLLAPGARGAAGTGTYTVSGTVSGLSSGASIALIDDGADQLPPIKANGIFTFSVPVATGSNYAVTIGT
jgi:hypothetical protein